MILVLLLNFGSFFHGLRSKAVFSWGSVLVSTESPKLSVSRVPTGRFFTEMCSQVVEKEYDSAWAGSPVLVLQSPCGKDRV